MLLTQPTQESRPTCGYHGEHSYHGISNHLFKSVAFPLLSPKPQQVEHATSPFRLHRRVSQEKGESTVEEDKLLRRRKELRDEALQQELKLQIEKNEILELRSLGIRTAMQKYKDLQDTDQDGGRAHSHDGVSKVSQQSAFFM